MLRRDRPKATDFCRTLSIELDADSLDRCKLMVDGKEEILCEGQGARVVIAMFGRDRSPAGEFLQHLAKKEQNEFDKLAALLERVAELGPQNYRNDEKVKQLGDGLFEFKSGQVRVFWCYGRAVGEKRKVVLLNGVVKKQDRHRASDVKKAVNLMTEWKARNG